MTKVYLYRDEWYDDFCERCNDTDPDGIFVPEPLIVTYEKARRDFIAARDAVYAAAGIALHK